ncbi:hypothetical protein B0H17DRAFT_1129295 [Mycena rosella]|uniref:Cytochrome P450 n=1 Tax=Mycena rosella TaxID=1033263 RepID=A0AAD7DTS3_MYCRO|nr:hypothetical protein B0H17DRAFT_1129295 [Mycena rosella]
MVMDLVGWDFIGLMKYGVVSPLPVDSPGLCWTNTGDEWRIHRRLFNQAFHAKASDKYEPQELEVARGLLKCLLETPDAFSEHFRQCVRSVRVFNGSGVESQDGGRADNIRGPISRVIQHQNIFPILKHLPNWFPGAGFKRQAAEWRKFPRALLEMPFAETKRQILRYSHFLYQMCQTGEQQASGISRPSFTSSSFALKKSTGVYYTETQVMQMAVVCQYSLEFILAELPELPELGPRHRQKLKTEFLYRLYF